MLSSTLSRIGCEKLASTPGRIAIAASISRTTCSLVTLRFHSPGGLSPTKISTMLIGTEEKEAKQRHQRQRKEQRAHQGGGDGPRHRGKDAALVPLQGEDRDVGRDDDQHGEESRPAHVRGRLQDQVSNGLDVACAG